MIKMTPRRIAAAVVLLLLLALTIYRVGAAIKDRVDRAKPRPAEAASVEVVAVSKQTFERKIVLTGSIEPWSRVDVFPKVPGRVKDVAVRIGDRVDAAQVLGTIEDRDYTLQVAQAGAQLDQAEALAAQAAADQTRMARLFEGGMVSRGQMEDAEARARSTRAQAALAKAGLDLANEKLAETRLLSPVSGFVTRRLLDPGGMAQTSNPVFTVESIDKVKIAVGLAPADLARVQPGSTVTVSVDALPDRTFAGRVDRVVPSLDPKSRTADAEVSIKNKGRLLKPGFFARITIPVGRGTSLTVPQAAVAFREGKPTAFLVNDGTLHARRVKTGESADGRIEILEGLREGDRVVASPLSTLDEGSQVTVIERK
ncbi:MAG: hypothetical protein A2V83_02705 [Nitrospirae bacterium RBG_16_64_22]|nr:MAG: hypothetical protein A2V83_02705 [Nitrospirae bacterium RBG_16_64_22]